MGAGRRVADRAGRPGMRSPGLRRWDGASTASGSGWRSPAGPPARMPAWRPGCPRPWDHAGSVKAVACQQSAALRCRGAACRSPSEKSSPSSAPKTSGGARSHGGWGGLRRPSPGSCAATPRPVAVGSHRPAHTRPRAAIQQCRQVQHPLAGFQLGEVAHPQRVGPVGGEVAAHQVGRGGRGGVAAGALVAPADPQAGHARLAHQPGDPLAAQVDALGQAQLGVDPGRPVGAPAGLVDLADLAGQPGVLQRPPAGPVGLSRRTTSVISPICTPAAPRWRPSPVRRWPRSSRSGSGWAGPSRGTRRTAATSTTTST